MSPDDPAAVIGAKVAAIVNGVYELLGINETCLCNQITMLDEYIGPGYGLETLESAESFKLLVANEGIVLDPVYTAKAMAALLDWIRKGKLTEEGAVLFWHTGRQMAMFFTRDAGRSGERCLQGSTGRAGGRCPKPHLLADDAPSDASHRTHRYRQAGARIEGLRWMAASYG